MACVSVGEGWRGRRGCSGEGPGSGVMLLVAPLRGIQDQEGREGRERQRIANPYLYFYTPFSLTFFLLHVSLFSYLFSLPCPPLLYSTFFSLFTHYFVSFLPVLVACTFICFTLSSFFPHINFLSVSFPLPFSVPRCNSVFLLFST